MKSFGTTPLAPHCQKSCHHEGYNEQKHHSHHDGNQIFSTETFFHHVLKDTKLALESVTRGEIAEFLLRPACRFGLKIQMVE